MQDALDLASFTRMINEKLILFNDGADYNQVVFLAGGAGSGKGFAIKNFMEGHKFKVIDVDKFKQGMLDLAKRHPEKYEEIKDLDLQNPKDVQTLHFLVKDLDLKNKTITNILSNANKGRLPNLLFDMTLKSTKHVDRLVPQLESVGYDSYNTHLVWILADYTIAVDRNKNRERIVPDDILLKTHDGAAQTMHDILKGKVPEGIDGSIRVILNNPDETEFFDQSDNVADKNKDKEFVKDFTYVTVKEPGEPMMSSKEMQERLYRWMRNNVPKTTRSKIF